MNKLILITMIALMVTVNIGFYAKEKELSDTRGILRGNIYAQDGKPIEGAIIKIIDTGHICSSNHFGNYYFKGLPIKEFQIEILKGGYHTVKEDVFATARGWLSFDIMLLSKNKKEYTRPSTSKITFSWRKNPEPDLAGYKIYRSDQPFLRNPDAFIGSPRVKLIKIITSPNETTFTDTSPLIGDNYYTGTSFDTLGMESPYSHQIYYYIAPPSKSKFFVYGGAIFLSVVVLAILLF